MNTLDEMFGEDSRKTIAKMEKRKKHTRAVEIVREATIKALSNTKRKED